MLDRDIWIDRIGARERETEGERVAKRENYSTKICGFKTGFKNKTKHFYLWKEKLSNRGALLLIM